MLSLLCALGDATLKNSWKSALGSLLGMFSQALQEAAMVLALHLPPALLCRQCNGNVQ